jgi:hypothetical protein
MHPGRAVKRAVTPKAAKRASRALPPIDNAVYSLERSAATTIRGCDYAPSAGSSCAPWGRRPSTVIAAARLIPATTTGVSALSQPAGMSRCLTSRSARYPAVIAAPRPPSARSAEASGRRSRAAIAHVCAASITTGADSAVPISTQSRPTADGSPRQNGMSKAWRRRIAKAIPPSPERSWAADTAASTRFSSMARQLNRPSPMAHHPRTLIATNDVRHALWPKEGADRIVIVQAHVRDRTATAGSGREREW